ncbi:MAG: hypothetical protein GKR94_23930 [Gammaproteobacteria bacterium]|nr:hypothetical protein [Gammaproteobacteria bacterium]
MLALIERTQSQVEFEAELSDPAYRAYVESELDAAEADRMAGRTYSFDEIRTRSASRLKALHG